MNTNQNKSPRCLYHAKVCDFLKTSACEVLGNIVMSYHGVDQTTTNEAWEGEIKLMQEVLKPWKNENSEIIFEYNIPRLGKRIDVVLLLKGMIFCLEFKVGKKEALQADVEQVLDYALDLKNFHMYSAERPIVPILVPTLYDKKIANLQPSAYNDDVYNPLIVGRDSLQEIIEKIVAHGAIEIDNDSWGYNWIISPYKPTPTIIEAARTLYENHSVEDITRHEADEVSTDATIEYIMSVIEKSKTQNAKSICFVTGVPGAGKTLVGLDVAIKQTYKEGELDKENGAVYLSGNGPLVAVLTEALAKDNQKKCVQKGEKKNISDSRREVSEFIQMIHRYRDNMLAKIKNPVENGILEIDPQKAIKVEKAGYGEVEHVAIFDEAQRSWTHERIAAYLKRGGTYGNKLKVPNFPVSEANFLIWSLDQRKDWAVIICLVGGGQEINTGEAGITEWIKAINEQYTHWNVYISNDFVHSVLSFNPNASSLYKDICTKKYPIFLTRDMDKARAWLRQNARGSQQTGILVSKVAARFKPLAVNILAQGDENAVHWFLEDKTDIRSSNYLEEAATEIQVQGLELDFACVLWDADMRCENNKWGFYKFNGRNKWTPENNPDNRKYMLNAYRVLLTRARQGLVICVPYGNDRKNSEGFYEDPTRLPEFYNGTYEYLKGLGIKEL